MPWETRSSTTTYDLVSHGQDVEGKNACWGEYNENTSTGWGPVFQNFCIHSGSTEYSGGDAVWYNYTIATAGSIVDENTTAENPATNSTKATESICPKGWALPTTAQMRSIGPNAGSNTYISSFSPTLGGYYYDGVSYGENARGHWWSSEAGSGARRYRLTYDNGSLFTGSSYRLHGYYIRCVPKS